MEVLRNGFEKNAKRIDADCRFAEKEPEGGDGNNPPAIKGATV